MNKILRKGMVAFDTPAGFGVANSTMLERLERDVRKDRVHFDLGIVNCSLRLSLVYLGKEGM